MSLRFHEIAESRHRILNPFTEQQLQLLGEICRLHDGVQQLDLCCGKGEMLCQWSARFGIRGTGVDISPVFLAAAGERAQQLQCSDRIRFIHADAASYPIQSAGFDIVNFIGATWIGNGLTGTLELMRPGLRSRDSLLLVGEPYWNDQPPEEATRRSPAATTICSHRSTARWSGLEAAGLELVELVLADGQGWDRYVARQWLTVSDWLRANEESPEAARHRDPKHAQSKSRRAYVTALARRCRERWGRVRAGSAAR